MRESVLSAATDPDPEKASAKGKELVRSAGSLFSEA